VRGGRVVGSAAAVSERAEAASEKEPKRGEFVRDDEALIVPFRSTPTLSCLLIAAPRAVERGGLASLSLVASVEEEFPPLNPEELERREETSLLDELPLATLPPEERTTLAGLGVESPPSTP